MRDAATRLGTGASGTADVMADGFFAPLDFALVMQRANPNPKPKPNPNPNPNPKPCPCEGALRWRRLAHGVHVLLPQDGRPHARLSLM